MFDALVREANDQLARCEVATRHQMTERGRQRHRALVAALVALGEAGVEGVPPVVVDDDGEIVD
jgi:hypothetical protein